MECGKLIVSWRMIGLESKLTMRFGSLSRNGLTGSGKKKGDRSLHITPTSPIECAREFVIWESIVGSSAFVSLLTILARDTISIGQRAF
jgi:hypothetical protein